MKTGTPFLSVVVICCQQERFIAQCLDGILAQKTDFPFELLISDDASTDSTGKTIAEYAAAHPAIVKPVFHQQRIGAVANWVDTFSRVTGKYAAVCEGDDYWTDPLKLQKQVNFLETHPDFSMCAHPGAILHDGMSSARHEIIYPEPGFHARFSRKGCIPLKYMLHCNALTTASAVYRWKYYGDTFRKIHPRGICPGDWYLHLLHAKEGKIGYLPDVMSVYRKHDGGMYSSLEKQEAAFFQKYKEPELAFYDAVFQLFAGRKKETELWEETYLKYLNRMLSCFLATRDETSLIWFWNRFPDRFERMLALNYFKSPPHSLLERLGRIIARMGMEEEGIRKTISRLICKEPLP